MTTAKVELGRRLFFDTRLSVTGAYSCASCHDPRRAFSDGRSTAIGATGQPLRRNAMALVNVAWNSSYGWDTPGQRTLESQMHVPLYNTQPIEMGLSGREEAVLALLRADDSYAQAFARAFPADAKSNTAAVTIDNLIRAMASYERTLVFGDSPFDRYVYRGEHGALGGDAKAGMRLFYSTRLGCGNCHRGFNFSGSWNQRGAPPAKPAFTCNGAGPEVHRVPTLRNVEQSAPYMHDGRYATLDDVVRHYESAAAQRTCADPRLQRFALTDNERRQLVAFLQSLTSPAPVASTP